MKLSVYVLGREVAVLEPVGDFKSVLNYLTETATDDFVSLTMPVRTESYVWDDQLPPIFQMNLPEGYILKESSRAVRAAYRSGPDCAVVGHRSQRGRAHSSGCGGALRWKSPPDPIEVAELLQGDNSEEAFAELVREHATSGVSGVLPKFLDTQTERLKQKGRQAQNSNPIGRCRLYAEGTSLRARRAGCPSPLSMNTFVCRSWERLCPSHGQRCRKTGMP